MSDYLDPGNEELLKDFFDEADLQISLFEQNILALEQNHDNREAVDEMFRAAHTLKGASATVQMGELAAFTHTVEDVLDQLRSGDAEVSNDIIESLLASIDTIKSMLDSRSGGEVFDDDISSLVERLHMLAGLESNGPAEQIAVPPASDGGSDIDDSRSMTEYELLEMLEESEPGATLYRIDVRFDEQNPMNTVGGVQVYAALRGLGTVLECEPGLDELYEDRFHETVHYFLASHAESPEVQHGATIADVTLNVDVTELGNASSSESRTDEDAAVVAEVSEDQGARSEVAQPPIASADAPAASPGKRRSGGSGSVLRVDSRRIDNLLNLVSEAVINKATFNQISQSLGEAQEALQQSDSQFTEQLRTLFEAVVELVEENRDHHESGSVRSFLYERFGTLFDSHKEAGGRFKEAINLFRNTAGHLNRITGELQEGVMQIRMVPISQIFTRFPRLVRDVSKSLGKEVNLEIEGEETELDKSVIEDLLDPLIHCVRNSIDHGLETPEVRREAGKQDAGTVTLRAGNEGNQIVIEVEDDGRGIDVESVYQKAVDRGIIHPSKQLSDVEAFNLIFEPGFSTAPKITDISGRGVGLDVVKKQIEKLNGSVSVWSAPGEGTRTTIKLPLTLAILQGLLVRVGAEVYAVPINSVVESHRIRPEEIRRIDNYEVMDVRDEVVSLLRLSRLFRIQAADQPKHFFVVIVGSDEKKVGLIVDSLIGEEDVVIKPLRDRFTITPGIAGATILGSGHVALIIDVSQLLDLGMSQDTELRERGVRAIV